MRDSVIGFLVGVIIAFGLIAKSVSIACDDVRSEAISSGYMVHEGEAYRVIPVKTMEGGV